MLPNTESIIGRTFRIRKIVYSLHGYYAVCFSVRFSRAPMDAEPFREAVSYALSCFKLDKLKPEQEDVIYKLYQGQDVFAWFPTGYGKSICYQLLPFLFDAKLHRQLESPEKRSKVIVVSPLVSLMVDQVSNLKTRGISAGILSGNKGGCLELTNDQCTS